MRNGPEHPTLPFDDSRRLTGCNLHFADVGAVLETVGVDVDAALLAEWEARVRRMRGALGWPQGPLAARTHAGGASLALAAPLDQLLTATEVDEWATLSTLFVLGRCGGFAAPHAPGHPAFADEDSARHTLQALAREERHPALLELVRAAEARGLTALIDDESVSLGIGAGSRTWPATALPLPAAVDWSALHEAPIALVTGSNGKTTTTRLIAAALRAHGCRVAHACTDGVFVDAVALASGDYSGPAGARTALRAAGVDAAVLETARGGLLRRGLAVRRADVAVVTNVSDDHFGEYGVHDLDDLAAVKLTVARALGRDGVLVLNADDARLAHAAGVFDGRVAWFAFEFTQAQAQARVGEAACGLREGRLILHVDGTGHDLGAAAAMPLTFGGAARYNVANLAAAALAAHALGVPPATLRELFARFGGAREDNPGRLQHWAFGGVEVFVDYAHNPDGLRGLLELAERTRRGRLGLLLGQAGNREDAEIRELAAVAAGFAPDRVVLKDIRGMLRGRLAGEVPELLRRALQAGGVAAARIAEVFDEFEAVRSVLAWARPGDTVVLPVHGNDAKPRVAALLDALQASGWQAGAPLPRCDDAASASAPAA